MAGADRLPNRWKLFALVLVGFALSSSAVEVPDVPEVARLVVEGTNDFRREQGLPGLEVDGDLEKAAREFAGFIAKARKLAHEADGRTPAQRARAHGYDYCLVAENIGYQYRSGGFRSEALATKLVEGWKKSPGHRRNLADRGATQTAVAVAPSEEGGYYAVQMFGRPASRTIRFEVRNESLDRLRYRVGDQDFSLSPRTVQIHRRCGPEKVVFDADRRDEPGGEAVEAEDGDRFVVTRRAGGFAVRRR